MSFCTSIPLAVGLEPTSATHMYSCPFVLNYHAWARTKSARECSVTRVAFFSHTWAVQMSLTTTSPQATGYLPSLCQCVTSYLCEPPDSRDHCVVHINGRNHMILQISICHTQKSIQLYRA